MFPIGANEADRLAALRGLGIVDTPEETHFDAVCRLARDLFQVPISLVSFVEEDRQWFKAKCGTDLTGTERGIAFCNYTVLSDDVFVVEDAASDARFSDNLLVRGKPGIRFYAGAPLTLRPGLNVGALCVKDTRPRGFSPEEMRQLRDLAEIVVAHLRLHEAKRARDIESSALQAARDAQRVAENTASFGHWRIDTAARTVAWSDGIASLFGAPMPESGRISLDAHLLFYHPDERDIVRRRIEEVVAGTNPDTVHGYRGQGRVIRADGEERIVTVRSVPVRDETGTATAVYGVLLDVTEHARAEERLRDKSALLRTTLESMEQGLIFCGPDQRVRVHNRRASEIIELPPGVLHDGARMADVHRFLAERGEFADDADHLGRMTGTGDQTCVPSVFERSRPDGTCMEVRGTALADGGVVWTFTDITHRREAERAVRKSEASYRLLADAASDMVIRRNLDNVRTYVSPASRELLGYAPEELMAMPLSDMLHLDDQQRTLDFMSALMAGRVEHDRITHRLRHREGRWVWVEARTRLVRDEQGKPAEVITAARDISERKAAEDTLRESEARLKASEERLAHALDSGSDGLWDWNLVTNEAWFSERWYGMVGYKVGELEGHLRTWERIAHPEDAERAVAAMRDHLKGLSPIYECEYRLRRKDGSHVWVLTRGKVMSRDGNGRALRIVGTQIDITRRREAEDGLRLSEERLALALDSGSDGLWDWNLATGAIRFSGQYFRTLGYGLGEIESHIRNWSGLVHPDDAEEAMRLLTEHLKGRSPVYECEYRMKTKTGAYRWTLARGKAVSRDAAGRAQRMVGTYIDITQRKEAERQIAHIAVHDALTDLPNRVLFRDRLDLALARAKRHDERFAVLACDLDRFKAVNDTLGHPAGDKLLCRIAERLRAVIRDGDTIARLGGDEFAIILAGLTGMQEASLAAQRVIEVVGQPVDLDGETANVGISIGIALGTAESPDADSLFKNADIALYRAKAAGRNTYSFYEPGMDAAVAERNLLERDLREAVRTGGFELHYQPIVRLADDATNGFEALLRWRHSERGMVSPGTFIPVAEETGLIVPLGEWALRQACREAAGWPSALRVAVNVSAVQFQKPGLEQAVIGALAASGLAPRRLELEITESVLIEDSEAAIACLHRLRALGVRVALDDFGTGYSSLSYLRRFPFDKIKIDRAFVRDIADPDTAAIVRAIVGIGERLGTAITAEGVETGEQLERVRQEGCTEVQGYLLGRPLPAADALEHACDAGRRIAA